ncbi:hypothetical protein [Cytobacillus kochii]|uniref:hypothetical protein n=1 Tax=Cytobacillus kochii TaxID=859143 RepID=UPI00402AAC1C
MKNTYKIILFVCVLIFIGIGTYMSMGNESAQEVSGESQEIEEINNVEETDLEEQEENFIVSTIEHLNTIQEDMEELEFLLSDIQEQDDTWRLDVQFIADSSSIVHNNVSSGVLNEEQKEKYKMTLASNQSAIELADSIYSDTKEALNLYDKRLFEDIYTRLGEQQSLIKETLGNLEEERYN